MIALPHSTKEQARRAYLAGERVTKIALDLGLKRSTVAQWSCRGGWPTERKRFEDSLVETIRTTTTDVTKRHISLHFKHINRVVAAQIDSLADIPLKDAHSIVEVAKALKTYDDIQRRNLGLYNDESGAPPAVFGFHLADVRPVPKVLEVAAESV